METGTIKFYRSDSGYGFIRPSNGGSDIFFHFSELPTEYRQQAPQEGTYVEYETGVRNGKPIARNVRIVGGAE